MVERALSLASASVARHTRSRETSTMIREMKKGTSVEKRSVSKYVTLWKHPVGTNEGTLKLHKSPMQRCACRSSGNATAGSDHFIEPMI